MTYEEWLDNEYRQWVGALLSSTVYNFKEHPMVKRMLGEIAWPEDFIPVLTSEQMDLIETIDNIGRHRHEDISGTCWRMVYYADMILRRKNINMNSIIEIGGGSGQFYAILRALGYTGSYYIADLPEVQAFQHRYLKEVEHQTDLYLAQSYPMSFRFCVSFYALGEFDDLTKAWYIQTVVSKCPHGFIIWNPHSGATADIPFKCTVQDEYPLLVEGNKQLEW